MAQKYKNLSRKIIALRRSVGDKTQEAFGKRFNPPVKRSTVAHWETGRTEPSGEHILEMTEFKDEYSWWWKLYLVDDEVKAEDEIDYAQSGQRINWVTAEDYVLMSADWPSADDIEEMQNERVAPPTTGPLVAAFNLPADKQIQAIANVIQSKPVNNQANQLDDIAITNSHIKQSHEEEVWKRKTKNFKQAVVHLINKKMDFPESYWDVFYKRGTLRAKADYCDGMSIVLIVNEQVKFKNEALGRNMGKLLLLEKMTGSLMNKMLAICVDIENPKVNHLMLDDISAAKNMGITLTYVSPDEEDSLAQEIIDFIKTNLERKIVKVKSPLSLAAGETINLDNKTLIVEK